MAARFVISGWDKLEDIDRSNIAAMLTSVIGVESDIPLDISDEAGNSDDVREIFYDPTVLAAVSSGYINCRRAGGSRRVCEALYGTRALFSSDHVSLV
ncbi:MAG: hypothetical protein ACOYME_00390 [Prochlorotrichaceae cyanobacterium]